MGVDLWRGNVRVAKSQGIGFLPRSHLLYLCPHPLHQLSPIDREIIYIPFMPIWQREAAHDP